MQSLNSYRFQLIIRSDVGELSTSAYTTLRASSQSQALADLTRKLSPWESAAPLHGPSVCLQWFA